jgi:hypothetical protein
MTEAASPIKLAEVQYVHSQGCGWPDYLRDEAASSEHFELLRWCDEHS